MTSFSYSMQQLPSNNDFATPLGPGLDSADDTCEALFPILGPIDYLYHVSDPYSLNPEGAFHDSVSSLFEKDVVYHLVSEQEQHQLGYDSWRNWDGEYETLTGCMDGTFFSYDSESGNCESHKAEDWFKSDEPVRQTDIDESQLCYDDCLWSGYESWFKYEREDDSYDYAREMQPANACGYHMDEIGFCEGIVGYWQCLIEKHDDL